MLWAQLHRRDHANSSSLPDLNSAVVHVRGGKNSIFGHLTHGGERLRDSINTDQMYIRYFKGSMSDFVVLLLLFLRSSVHQSNFYFRSFTSIDISCQHGWDIAPWSNGCSWGRFPLYLQYCLLSPRGCWPIKNSKICVIQQNQMTVDCCAGAYSVEDWTSSEKFRG